MRLTSCLVIAVSFLGIAVAQDFNDAGVLVLEGDESFEAAKSKYSALMVEFYAPWCGHCKTLEPQYEQAASSLKKFRNTGVVLAKMDASAEVNKNAAAAEGIEGFPTLKMYTKGKAPEDYSGERDADSIVAYMKKYAGSPVKRIKYATEMEKYVDSEDVTVIGFFKDYKGDEAKAFELCATAYESTPFAMSSSKVLATKYGVEMPAVVLKKKFDEGHAELLEASSEKHEKLANVISKFVDTNKNPVTWEFSEAQQTEILQGMPQRFLWGFVDKGTVEWNATAAAFKEIGVGNRGFVKQVMVDAYSNPDIIDYFMMTNDVLPVIMVIDIHPHTGRQRQFRLTEAESNDISADILTNFLEGYKNGTVTQYWRSQELPDPEEEAETNVKTAVALNFKELVMGEGYDALVEFYAPWCDHCRNLEPKFAKLGDKYSKVDHVRIVKCDFTNNEVDHHNIVIEAAPTIYFFKDGDKMDPVEYKGDMDAQGMSDFIMERATKKFKIGSTEGGGFSKEEREQRSQGTGPVKVITEDNFEAQAMNGKTDMLLKFYAPWCGHCKELAPTWEKLAEKLKVEERITIAKVDASKNGINHPKLKVEDFGFPTIVYFPMVDKANPIVYSGNRDVDGFVSFLKDRVPYDITENYGTEEDYHAAKAAAEAEAAGAEPATKKKKPNKYKERAEL
jgi:protein disulfide-isomerase-like protein